MGGSWLVLSRLVRRVALQADLNNDGKIDYHEFVTMMAPSALPSHPASRRCSAATPCLAEVAA